MKFSIEIDPQKNSDEVGEFLRKKFFSEGKNCECDNTLSFGCYSCFHYNSEVKNETKSVDEDSNIHYHAEMNINGIVVKIHYFWDGDGYLEFIFPDDSILWNSDCKKNNNWYYTYI